MRTTITFDDDVAAALAKRQREHGVGVSRAVNDLVRAGLVGGAPGRARTPPPRPRDMGVEVDVANVWQAIEDRDGPGHR